MGIWGPCRSHPGWCEHLAQSQPGTGRSLRIWPGHPPTRVPVEHSSPGASPHVPKAVGAQRTGVTEVPTVTLPGGILAAKCPSRWSLALSPHNVLVSGPCLPGQSCSDPLTGTHESPYPAKRSDTLSLRDPPWLSAPTLLGTHIDSRGNQGRRLRSRTRLQLALGSRSASSLVTVPLGARLGGLTCCPCGRSATAGWRLAGPTARAERLGAPLASAARRAPPREWAAAARLLVCRTPAPRPSRPGEKALIGKIAQERGWRGAAGARRELRRPGRRRRPPTPDELTVQRGEGCAQGVCRACVSAQQQRPPPPGSRPQSRPPAFAPSLGCPDKFDSALGGGGRQALAGAH